MREPEAYGPPLRQLKRTTWKVRVDLVVCTCHFCVSSRKIQPHFFGIFLIGRKRKRKRDIATKPKKAHSAYTLFVHGKNLF